MATKTFQVGDVLLKEGETPRQAFRIVGGSVELSRADDGAAMPFDILDPGATVGAEELLSGEKMPHTAAAMTSLNVEVLTRDQVSRLLGKPVTKKNTRAHDSAAKPAKGDGADSRALVALSSQSGKDYTNDDTASYVLKPGLLRRLLKPEFIDLHDRLDVRVSPLMGDQTDGAGPHLMAEFNKRRGLRAKMMPARVALDVGDDPVQSMADLRRAVSRWMMDNGGDVVVWGALTPDQKAVHLRFFVRELRPIDPFPLGDGWSMIVLPYPLDGAAAHRLHSAILAAIRSNAAGKQLTVRRDLEVLMEDARDQLLTETPGLNVLQRAEDRTAQARILANALQFKRRADDARTAISLLDIALNGFDAKQTPVEWALAKRDRAYLGQFLAERTNDTDALRASMDDATDALRVLRPTLFPTDWAVLNDRLGLALARLDPDSGDMSTLQRALRAFEDALSIYDRRTMPSEWAEAMAHFGQVALVIGREQRSPAVLLRAVEACNAVVSVRDRKNAPMHWASAQNNLGSALFLYGRIAGDSAALVGARDAFETAHRIYMERGSERLATVAAKNLRHVAKALSASKKPKQKSKVVEARDDWAPNENDPPPLPWEFEDTAPNLVTPSKPLARRPRDDDHEWFKGR